MRYTTGDFRCKNKAMYDVLNHLTSTFDLKSAANWSLLDKLDCYCTYCQTLFADQLWRMEKLPSMCYPGL